MDQPGAFVDPNEPVGAALARLRRARGLSGAEVGRRAGMSQAKVSRVENSKGKHTTAEIGKLARALEVDEAGVRQLISRAEMEARRPTDWRPTPVGLADGQRVIADEEAEAETLFCFESTIVHGLLQTSEYARASLSVFQVQEQVVPGDVGNPAASVAETLSARVARQELLTDPRKSFRFVLMEAALSNSFCAPVDMLAQLERLREVATQLSNVEIAIVPAEARPAMPPLHGFEILGDRLVIFDTFTTSLTSDAEPDVRLYRKVFDSFAAAAVTDIEPILARHEVHYTELIVAGVHRGDGHAHRRRR